MYKNTALLVIDVQVGLFETPGKPTYREEALLANIAYLLKQARATSMPIIFIQHQENEGPLISETRGWQIHPAVAPLEHETIIHKRASDSFLNTALAEELRSRDITHLIITGCRTEFCVDTTCRSAISHGYDITLVADAHSTIDRDVLTADLIVAHHNSTLDDFGTDEHVIIVKPTSSIEFQQSSQEEARFRKARIVHGIYYDGMGYGILREEWFANYAYAHEFPIPFVNPT